MATLLVKVLIDYFCFGVTVFNLNLYFVLLKQSYGIFAVFFSVLEPSVLWWCLRRSPRSAIGFQFIRRKERVYYYNDVNTSVSTVAVPTPKTKHLRFDTTSKSILLFDKSNPRKKTKKPCLNIHQQIAIDCNDKNTIVFSFYISFNMTSYIVYVWMTLVWMPSKLVHFGWINYLKKKSRYRRWVIYMSRVRYRR